MTSNFMMYSSDASNDSIPSVSSNRIAYSLHSSIDVDIHIPCVHGSSVLLILKTSLEPKNRERKYDLPLRYGPKIERTASGFIPSDLIRLTELGTIHKSGLKFVSLEDV